MENGKSWSPVGDQILTRWAKDVDPKLPLPEYPRPQFERKEWFNLNGLWDYAICPKDVFEVKDFDGKILVPFPIESALSGVGKKLHPNETLWYHRKFQILDNWKGKKIILHFGAVDWESRIWINKNKIGDHKGGYTPFEFDISDSLNDGENEITISVWDPTDKGKQERGKQSLNPKNIFYTAVSGIWQTVWLEPVPKTYLERIYIKTDIDNGTVSIQSVVKNPESNDYLEAEIINDKNQDSFGKCKVNQEINIKIRSPKLWSPDDPFLYSIKFLIKRGNETLDEVSSYFGMRKVTLSDGEKGIVRIKFNNEKFFQFGTLDQGYWPDGLYTAPTDEALKYDIHITKELGFNMIRKHVKVEPARWYYHCDKLGILVWQDMPNGGFISPILEPLNAKEYKEIIKKTGRNTEEKQNYYNELSSMIKSLYNFPSIIVWVPFNEGWGQFETEEVTKRVKQQDPFRLVDSASGWYDYSYTLGDIYDMHRYPNPLLPDINKANLRALVVGEFGGLGLEVESHMWITTEKFFYRNFEDSSKLTKRYERLIRKVNSLREDGLSAAIYTQITDVEGENNGLLTYDRDVIKIDQKKLRDLNLSTYTYK
jgi:beta-galactosidase/beta-glucuronidase